MSLAALFLNILAAVVGQRVLSLLSPKYQFHKRLECFLELHIVPPENCDLKHFWKIVRCNVQVSD